MKHSPPLRGLGRRVNCITARVEKRKLVVDAVLRILIVHFLQRGG